MPETTLLKIDVPFTFTRRPEPLPPDLRPNWRVAMLLLLLRSCRSEKASLEKLHVLNWAIRTPESRRRFLAYVKGNGNPDDVIIRFEPGLNYAIDFARGDGLIKIEKGKRVKLTDHGSSIAQQIDRNRDCMVEERRFFEEVKLFVLEKDIKTLLNWEMSL